MGKRAQVEKQQQKRTFWPAPATSADATANGDWGLTVTKGKGGIQWHCPLGPLGAAGQMYTTSSANPMMGHSLGKPWVKYPQRKGWWGTEKWLCNKEMSWAEKFPHLTTQTWEGDRKAG